MCVCLCADAVYILFNSPSALDARFFPDFFFAVRSFLLLYSLLLFFFYSLFGTEIENNIFCSDIKAAAQFKWRIEGTSEL